MPKILWTADWHLVDTKPRCRLDEDWYSFLENIIQFVIKIANQKKAILGIGGDLFGRRSPNVSNYLVSMFIRNVLKVKNGTRILAGNHDEYFHNFDYVSKSSFGILDAFITNNASEGKLNYIDGLGTWHHFNENIVNPDSELVFVHRLVFESTKTIPPNLEACTAKELLEEFPKAKYIFTGDMHRGFIYENKGRYVINPGSLYRGSSDQINYQPIIYFVDTDNDIVEEINIPDNDLMVTDEYIQEENKRNDRIEAFIEGIKSNGKISLDFLSNLEESLNKNDLDKDTIKVIRELCYEEE